MTPNALIPTLRHDHAQMRELLETVRRHGVSSTQGHAYLKQARQLIVEHLRLEDAQLYPALRGCAETVALANTYANEMQELSREILSFFDSMQNEHNDLVFARAFGKMMGTLNKRWTREEIRLYPAYDEHCAGVRKAG